MPNFEITVYATNWCWDCRRVRKYLDQRTIPYQWINIDNDPQAEKYVLEVNRGMRSVPTLVFPDGSILTEPSNFMLDEKLTGYSSQPAEV
jgi:mycoredoxin